MSSFIKFSEAQTIGIWTASFKAMHRFLKKKSSEDPVAARVIEESPIAQEIGFLDLSAFTPAELHHLTDLICELRANPPEFSNDPCFQQQIDRLPQDLDTVIQGANYAMQVIGSADT